MNELAVGMVLAGGVPLLWAVVRLRHTSLLSSLIWGLVAWLAWVVSASWNDVAARYLALCLTCCAGVAVLGARRPGSAAWNAVVAGLLAVLLLPLGQALLTSTALPVDSIRSWFMIMTLAVGLLNFVPTRCGLGAAVLLTACVLEWRTTSDADGGVPRIWALCLAGAAPWLAAVPAFAVRRSGSPEDRLWRGFRDRFGIVWAQRLREQFNRAAEHAGLPAVLGWTGIYPTRESLGSDDKTRCIELLRALMQRFDWSERPIS